VTRILSFLVLTLLFMPTASAQEFNDAQKAQINKMFEAYLLENGETVIKSVEKYQEQKDEQDRQASKAKAKVLVDRIESGADLPMTGNKDGDITLIEFFDYNCGYCSRALEELVTVLEKDKNLKVVFFDMPILGPPSLEASKWSLAAHKQDKYFEYHSALLNHKGQKSEKTLEKLAKDLGLNIEQLKKDKDSKEIADMLTDNVEQATEMNIRGTPGFIINGEIFPGYMPADRIIEILKDMRSKN